MRPHPVPSWGSRKDLGIVPYSGWNTFSSASQYDFKTMSMFQHQPQKPKPQPKPQHHHHQQQQQQHHHQQQQKPQQRDYFSSKPVQRSSPTSSLTADLDANFHIESR